MSAERNTEIAVSYIRDIHDAKTADFGTSIVMIPTEEKNRIVEMATGSRYPECSSHGDDNNDIKNMRRKTARDDTQKNAESNLERNSYKIMEGPIDLSASNSLKIEPDSEISDSENLVTVKLEMIDEDKKKSQKNKQRKRKTTPTPVGEEQWTMEHLSDGIPKQTGSKKEEVLKAARSLFSKRTRTLYHWMYPDTSKGQLKAIVSAAWDTLSTTEKEFYVSQVLGRFGVPAGSLMINPQLGGFQNGELALTSSIGSLAGSGDGSTSNSDLVPMLHSSLGAGDSGSYRKRWRRHAANHTSRQSHASSTPDSEDVVYDEDEFADDPELTTELIQFKHAMKKTE